MDGLSLRHVRLDTGIRKRGYCTESTEWKILDSFVDHADWCVEEVFLFS